MQDHLLEVGRIGSLSANNLSKVSAALQRRLFVISLIVSDLFMLALAFILAYLIRFATDLPVFYTVPASTFWFYFTLGLTILPLWVILFWVYRLYDWQVLLGGMQEYAGVFQACLTGAVLLAMAEFLLGLVIARGWVALLGVFSFVLVSGGRFFMRRLAYALRCRGYLTSAALIIGANKEATALAEQILAWPTSGLKLFGFVADEVENESATFSSLPVLNNLANLDEVVTKYQVEDLILASSAVSREVLLDIFKRYGVAPNVRLHLSSGLFEIITTGLGVKEIAYVSLINVNRARLTGTDLIIKTILDYCLAVSALVLTSPVLFLIAVLVKLDSPGPVLYRRRVMGLNGSQFDAFKFRTMHINGDALLFSSPELMDELATKHKIKGDPRITRVGQFLRKYSLDEIPQLFNILRGEMSLVGPRMISPPELKNYGQWAMNLLTVRPGLTGLWQVSGRSNLSYEDRVRMDMFYIRNYTIWLDLHLILRTIPVVIRGEGAY